MLFLTPYQWFKPRPLIDVPFWHTIRKAHIQMIRITTQPKRDQTVVTIDGRVTESDVKEIQRVRKGLKGDVVLNLRGLDGCAPVGIRLLRAWLDAGAHLEDATPFLEMILKDSTCAARPARRTRITKRSAGG